MLIAQLKRLITFSYVLLVRGFYPYAHYIDITILFEGVLALTNASDAESRTISMYNGTFWGDNSDAYRHGTWNALMVHYVGEPYAKRFADAHEMGASNYNPSNIDFDMDLRNNSVGRAIGRGQNWTSGCPNGNGACPSYKISQEIRKRVLDSSIEEINAVRDNGTKRTNIIVKYETLHGKYNKVIGIKFYIRKRKSATDNDFDTVKINPYNIIDNDPRSEKENNVTADDFHRGYYEQKKKMTREELEKYEHDLSEGKV